MHVPVVASPDVRRIALHKKTEQYLRIDYGTTILHAALGAVLAIVFWIVYLGEFSLSTSILAATPGAIAIIALLWGALKAKRDTKNCRKGERNENRTGDDLEED